jgi:uncharacterized protein YcaQ
MQRISKEQARSILLSAQGFSKPNAFGKGIGGAHETVKHLGYVQLDTLAVVARAHHHTFWARNNSYSEKHLEQLLIEGKVFEYWSHAASYLPMDDFRFSFPRKALYLSGHAHWFSKNKKLMQYVLDRIRAEGPLQSKDFESDRKRGSWWDWKPAKIALEQLFMEGSLMVKSRKGFQKVYDLTERVVPENVDHSKPSNDEYAEYLVRYNLRALGIATLKDFTHLRRGMQSAVTKAVKRMVKNGEVSELQIEGLKESWFAFPASLSAKHKPAKGTFILNPFDNLVIRRERLTKLFNWEFNLECYLPEHKRKFGYFCLPVLYNGEFAGMFDPKADRATKIFHVKKFHLNAKPSDEFKTSFLKSLEDFSGFNGCDKIVFGRRNDKKMIGV